MLKWVFFKIFSEPDETFLNVMDVNVEDGLFRYHIAMTTKFYLIYKALRA
jgi:hypothetical protein